MRIEQLTFDENMETYIELVSLDNEVCLTVSDGLFAYEEEWSEEYKTKTLNFINSFSLWRAVANQAALNYGKHIYNIEVSEKDLKLIKIFILFEQAEEPLFGVQYRTEFDVEHGFGLKIKGNNFEIVETGGADISFC